MSEENFSMKDEYSNINQKPEIKPFKLNLYMKTSISSYNGLSPQKMTPAHRKNELLSPTSPIRPRSDFKKTGKFETFSVHFSSFPTLKFSNEKRILNSTLQ